MHNNLCPPSSFTCITCITCIAQALAAADQGHNIGAPLPTPPVQAKVKNSLTNILTSRKEWATARKEISRAVDETLWRVDNETVRED